MNEKLDLTKILAGCEGAKLYLRTHGNCTLKEVDCLAKYPIILKVVGNDNQESFYALTKTGTVSDNHEGECILFPSKDILDWSKFEKPIKEGTPIMCCEDMDDLEREYWHYRKYTKREIIGWLYVIPFDKFNPNDIEASLEYNIQK